MKIESKFNIGDEVFFLHNNRVEKKIIYSILFPTVNSSFVRINEYRKPILLIKDIKEVEYNFLAREDRGDYFVSRAGILTESVVVKSENEIFSTKQELIDSL